MDSRDPSSHDSSQRFVPDRFESFDVAIERIDETYRAHLTDSPVGPRPPVVIDSTLLDGGETVPDTSSGSMRDVRRQPGSRDDLRGVGERLFRAVFVESIAEAFRSSVERARNEGAGLRIRVQLDGAPELAALPWEALWDPTERAFLADQPDLPVVRALGVTGAAPAVDSTQPLRLLALLPEPRGEGKLGGATEWQRIQKHLEPQARQGVLKAERLERPTLDALGRRIDEEPCHVLHIVAHGGPGEAGAGGILKMEDATGGLDLVTGGDLARALERRTAPRLVVLNACHGARASIDDAFDGMAQHLLSRGVPAVVAMRTAISDDAAVAFAAALYRELAAGRTIEAAMVEARRVLALGEHRGESATPVLYLRGGNVRMLESVGAVVDIGRGLRRLGWRWGLAAAAILLAGLLGVLMWPQVQPDPCPPPPGLHDLRFVKVGPGVVDLGDRKITVEEAFCIATKEVSRRDWLEVMGGELRREGWPLDWPMTDVTPETATSFLKKLEGRDPGATYLLPTAAQWEYAARADQTTDYFFGDDPRKLDRAGNCRNYLGRDGFDGPAPVGSFKPNAWGLYDVHGNVAEWVRRPDEVESPGTASDQESSLRLGGSFTNVPRHCTFSGGHSYVKASVDDREDTGFRVARKNGT